MSKDLNPEKALIFRITHVANLRWILRNGLHCANANVTDSKFVSIGNPDLIDRRRSRVLSAPCEGTLSDYIPFYFTPFSPMMYNIKTGWGGITKRENKEIIILVSSIWRLRDKGVKFVFSDRHAYLRAAEFYDNPSKLDKIDWNILQRRDFKRDPNDPEKFERYEAEALARTHVPVDALLGVACYNDSAKSRIADDIHATGVAIKALIKPSWYF